MYVLTVVFESHTLLTTLPSSKYGNLQVPNFEASISVSKSVLNISISTKSKYAFEQKPQ